MEIQGVWSRNYGPMGTQNTAKDPALAERMRRHRDSLNYDTGVEFAKFLGVSPQRWNNVEKGFPLGRSLASIIKSKVPGMDLDWLFDGDVGGLPLHLVQSLGDALPPPGTTRGKGGRPTPR